MQIHKDIMNRKGARKVSDIPEEVQKLLDTGKLDKCNFRIVRTER